MRTYAELPRLMTMMTGDEKHGPSATSTLDVLWVLYDRVLRVSPATIDDPGRNNEAIVYAGAVGLPNLTVVAVDNRSSSYGWGPGGIEALGDQVPRLGLGSVSPPGLGSGVVELRWRLIAVAACGVVAGLAVAIGATASSRSSLPSPASAASSAGAVRGAAGAVRGAAGAVRGAAGAVRGAASPAAGYLRGNVSEHGDVYPYAVYVPAGLRAGAPVVVVLHGCHTTADQMAAATQYDPLAERDRFIVLYPDVDALDADSFGGCWRGIWAPDLEGRGVGDAGAIADMTSAVMKRWHADPGRVYAIGISAGGYESAILGAYYPDLFAAIGIHSGAPYLGAEAGCLPAGANVAATAGLTTAALDAMGARARVMPVIVIHGDADPAVPYRCGQQALAQWLGVDDAVLARRGRPGVAGTLVREAVVPGGHGYTVASYEDGSGCVVAQLWTVRGMGHYWSGGSADPGSARYSDPLGPSAAVASWAFFSRWGVSGALGGCGGRAG